jgi:hypothetical protein
MSRGLPVVAWLTDLDPPDRFGLGLTMNSIACDRTAWRCTVDAPAAERWSAYARRVRVPRELRDELEAGRLPAHWWVSETPVAVLSVERRYARGET